MASRWMRKDNTQERGVCDMKRLAGATAIAGSTDNEEMQRCRGGREKLIEVVL